MGVGYISWLFLWTIIYIHNTPNSHTTYSNIVRKYTMRSSHKIFESNKITAWGSRARVEAAGPDSAWPQSRTDSRHILICHASECHVCHECQVSHHDLHHTSGDPAGGDHHGPGAPALPRPQHPLLQPHRGHSVHSPGGGHRLPGLRGEEQCQILCSIVIILPQGS